MKSREPNLTKQGLLIMEIQLLLRRFQDYEVLHVGHQGNEAAHLLVCHATQWKIQYNGCINAQILLLSRLLLDAAL